MTVKQLKEVLQAFSDDLPVYLGDWNELYAEDVPLEIDDVKELPARDIMFRRKKEGELPRRLTLGYGKGRL